MNSTDFSETLAKVQRNIDRELQRVGLEPRRAQTSFIAGALIRRQLRRELMSVAENGITFTEEKGLLDSLFIIRGTPQQIRSVNRALNAWMRRNP